MTVLDRTPQTAPIAALATGTTNVGRLAGSHVLVLNWRDVRHPQAGGAEQYMHRIARRWVAAGVRVTWYAARPEGAARREVIDGIEIVRAGGELSLYARTAARLVRTRGRFDGIVDCQNGIPFFAPAFAGDAPVVQLVHHVHQDQFATRFPGPLAAVGRMLEGRVARRVYGRRLMVAVSPSTRQGMRRRLGFRGPIAIVPNGGVGAAPVTAPRDVDPTITVVSRLVAHKRLDVLLEHVAAAVRELPRLRLEIVGDGPERGRLQGLVDELGLGAHVTLHGFAPDALRDELVSRAWLTTSTSDAEGWGCTVIEAASRGLPCVALDAPGIRDSVRDGQTGWLVRSPETFADVLVAALRELADDDRAAEVETACRAWAGRFDWDRSAEMLAGAVLAEMGAGADRRGAGSDLAAVARFRRPAGLDLVAALRPTDQVHVDGDIASVLLVGADEVDATAALARLGVPAADVLELRLAGNDDLLAGPAI